MSAVYLETSAALAWLLGEPDGSRVINILEGADEVVTSVLTLIEIQRAFIRAEASGMISEADRFRLMGLLNETQFQWAMMEITAEVRERACGKFPVEPVRTLDAMHLSTALEFLKVFPETYVLSLDQRIVSNLQPLGLSPVPSS
jgi:predicted nucleic acid-binding protein